MDESHLVGELRNAGLRATAPRRAVIGVLERTRKHLSAEDIHRSLTAGGVRIDLSSVYRTLALLLRLRLVRPVRPSGRHGHFEVGHREQVHLVCSRCGGVIETGLPRAAGIEHAVGAAARSRGFALTEFTVEAAGECPACRRPSTPLPRLRSGQVGTAHRGRAGAAPSLHSGQALSVSKGRKRRRADRPRAAAVSSPSRSDARGARR